MGHRPAVDSTFRKPYPPEHLGVSCGMGLWAVVAASWLSLAVPGETRTLRVTAWDAQGQTVRDLAPHEVAVLENGIARDVRQLKIDARPLTVALVVDSSATFDSTFRPNVVPALGAFLRHLPREARFCIWTTGDRPTRRVDYTDDVLAAESRLKNVIPQGGNTLLDTIDEALDDLLAREGERVALVIVTGLGPEFSSARQPRAVGDPARRGESTVSALEIEEPAPRLDSSPGDPSSQNGPSDQDRSPAEQRADYDRTLETLTQQTGGRLERVLSSQGAATAAERLAQGLGATYELTYATEPKLSKRRVEIKVARPNVRVQTSLPR